MSAVIRPSGLVTRVCPELVSTTIETEDEVTKEVGTVGGGERERRGKREDTPGERG